jgi:segregation and condensation protein A
MAYEVHLDVFDGPFDLLLQLISQQQVDLYEVSLASVVDAFCAEIARAVELDLEVATEFLLIASTLVELKCRRLLPDPEDVELDEELSIFEARDYLLARLVENTMFSRAAHALEELEQNAKHAHARRAGPDERFENIEVDLLANVTPIMLGELAARALAPRPVEQVSRVHMKSDEVTVASMIDELCVRLPSLGRASLRELVDQASPARIVACFLALLELYKREMVELDQQQNFGDLGVIWIRGDAPGASEIDTYDDLDIERVP